MNNPLFHPAFANPAGSPIRELFPYLSRPGIISLAGGYPSPALFDAEGLSAAAARVFADPAHSLQYGPTEGNAPLRQELLQLSASRGVSASGDQLLVTTGSQQGFDLLVRVLVAPGDVVLLEAPAYPAAIQALRLAGAALHEVQMDEQGLSPEAVEAVIAQLPSGKKPKLLYTVPTFSNPRGSLLPLHRRIALVELARRHGFLIVEDDPYGELSFNAPPPPTLYSLGGDPSEARNPTVYLSSLSKTVAPALRIGWMVAPAEIVRRCTIAKQTVDLCTSPVTQLIACDYLRSGRYPARVSAASAEFKARADALAEALHEKLDGVVSFERAQGGMFLWVESLVAVDAAQLFSAAVQEGVLFVPGAAFFCGTPERVCMRLSFAAASVSEIREGVARLARAWRQ